MVNGPPCPTCGTPLRWFPDHNAWGCDRCQRMIAATPYTPAAAPQQAYQPAPQGTPVPPVAPPPKQGGSKKGLLIVIALLVVGGGATAAILVLRGGSSPGGAGSRDALVSSMLAALDAGDGAALFALVTDESQADQFMDCDEKTKKKRDPARDEKHRAEERTDADKIAADAKGKGLALDSVGESATPGMTMKKGEKLKGCTLNVDIAIHRLEVKLHDRAGKKAMLKVEAIDIDGGWFLTTAPEITAGADCAGTVAKLVAKGTPEEKKLLGPDFESIVRKRCETDHWSPEAMTCLNEVTTLDASDKCVKLMTDQQQTALNDDVKKAAAAALAKNPPPPPPPAAPIDAPEAEAETPPPPAGGTDGIPPACAEYQAVMEKLASCDKLPEASRTAMKEAFEAMKKSWGQLKNLPPEAMKSMEDACKQGVDAMKQMSSLGC